MHVLRTAARLVLLGMILSCQMAWASATVPHRVAANTQQLVLVNPSWVYVDGTGALDGNQVAAIAQAGGMTLVEKPRIPLFHIDRGEALWIKVDLVTDAGAPVDWMLEVERANVDRVRVFTRGSDGNWTGFPEVGAAVAFSARQVDHRHFVFPVRIEPQVPTSFLVRVRYAGPSSPIVNLWQPAALQATSITMLGFSSLYFGLVAGMLLYNILLYVAVRDRGYLLYAGCVVCTSAAFASTSGVGAQFVWGEWPWWGEHAMYASYAAALVFSANLTREFLNTRERLPALDKVLRVYGWLSALGLAAALTLPSNMAAMIIVPEGLAGAVMVTGAAVIGVLRGWPGAQYFCAAWASMYFGVLMVLGRLFVLLPDNVFTANSLAVASALEMVLLSLALADRINDARRQKEQAQSVTMGILQASQALGTETRLDGLHARACSLMAELTGAVTVRLLLRDTDRNAWFLYGAEGDAAWLPAHQAQERGWIPEGALKLLDQSQASLEIAQNWLMVPIVHHGKLTAQLLLESRGRQAEFSAEARAAIQGIAGPLAVSLENVLLYERMEQHVAERTSELRAAQEQLLSTARRAGMAEVATNVLHNVGNALNSVNVSAELIRARIAGLRLDGLARSVDLMDAHAGDLDTFLKDDPKGRMLPKYLHELSALLERERKDVMEDVERLSVSVAHIKTIVATQQTYAGSSLLIEEVSPLALVDDALRIANVAWTDQGVAVVKELADVGPVRLDKARVVQILVNLITNATQAMAEVTSRARTLTLRLQAEQGMLRFEVEDCGAGIAGDHITKVFAHGFTTRKEGHGFGLHGAALAAAEMGGSLTAQSEGPDRGATFTLALPVAAA